MKYNITYIINTKYIYFIYMYMPIIYILNIIYIYMYITYHRALVGKPEGKKPLGRPRRRWEDKIKIDLQEVGGGRGDWMEWAQDRERWWALVSTVRKFRVP